MISELVLIRSYSTFWNSLFPAGDDYIRLINSGFSVEKSEAIEIEDKPYRRALLSNVSFSLFEKFICGEISQDDYKSLKANSFIISEIVNVEKKQLVNLRFGEKLSSKISAIDFKLIKWISDSLIDNYSHERDLIIRPTFSGCGIIFQAEGDIFYGNTLAEIKAGNRKFGIQDFRQLYVYLALNSISADKYKIDKIELYNPRTGVLWNEYIDVVSDNLSGTPTVEILNEIVNFISYENQSL